MGSGGGISFSGKKRYEGVMFNVISVTRGWVGVQFPEKWRYVTLEWPLTRPVHSHPATRHDQTPKNHSVPGRSATTSTHRDVISDVTSPCASTGLQW